MCPSRVLPERLHACLWLGLVLLLSPLLQGQPAEAPPQQPTTADVGPAQQPTVTEIPQPPPPEELSAEGIQALHKQVSEATDLDDATKEQLLKLYDEALKNLQKATESTAQATGYDRDMQEAPALLQTIRQELETPAVEPKAVVTPEAPLSEVQQRLAEAEAELAAAKKEAADLDSAANFRTTRRAELPKAITETKQKLDETAQKLAVPPVAEPSPLAEAQRVELRARKKMLEQQAAALEGERRSYEARVDLLKARQDRAARRVSQAEKAVKAWQDVVAERRRFEAERAAREAEEARRQAASAHPAVRELAEENAALAEQRTDLSGKIEAATAEGERITAALTTVQENFQNVRDKVQTVGRITEAISVLLRKQRADLPDPRFHRSRRRARQPAISEAQLQLLELQDERKTLVDPEAQVKLILEALVPSLGEAERQDIEAAARSLLQSKRDYLDSLLKDLNTYFSELVDLDAAEGQLITEAKDFRGYIDEHILWFRSTAPLSGSHLTAAWQGLLWVGSSQNWRSVGRTLWSDLRASPVLYGLAVVALAVWLFLQQRLRARLGRLAEPVRSASSDRFGYTVSALLLTLVLATGWPAAAGFLAWRLWAASAGGDFSKALAVGLRTLAVLLLTTEVIRQTCRKHGLAEMHFQWRRSALKSVHRNVLWLMVLALPAGLLSSLIGAQQAEEAWRDSLGRLALIVGLVALGLFAQRVLRPSGALLKDFLQRNRGGWLDRLRYVWYPLSFAAPLALAVAAGAGYHYTAQQLSLRLVGSLWLILALVFANAFTLRWLFVVRRRLALERARERLRAAAAERQEEPEAEEGSAERIEEPEVDIFSISTQAQQLVRTVVGLALLFGLWVVWADVLQALGRVNVRLWQTSGEEFVTLSDVALAVLVMVVTVAAARNIQGVLEITFLQRLPLEHGVRYAISTVARYLVTVTGIVVAFAVIGIGWSKVQWLVAAMTVGLGFGLQEIFANFISGLIILFERPMRLGDTVTIGDVTGTVTRIQIRATTVRDWDRRELIVPNKDFITGQLINWSLSDTIIRLVIPVGIAYGSDTQLAHRVLLQVASEHPRVLSEPKPTALFMEFGESSLNFELRVFIPSMEYFLQVRHDLQMAIDAAFRKAGIEIAFPQLDLHVRSTVPGPSLGTEKP